MTAFHVIFVAWRILLVIACLVLLATSIRLAIEERNTAYLFGLAFGYGAYAAARH